LPVTAVRRRVEPERADLDRVVECFGRLAPQQRADARHQLCGRERLGQVVVGPGVEPGDLVGVERARRQHDDRQGAGSGLGAPAPGQLQPGLARQHPVEDHEVGDHPVDFGLRGFGVGRDGHLEAGVAQVDRDQLGDRRLVLDDQDPAHVLASRFSAPSSRPCRRCCGARRCP
jgi:hypothetical protein